MNDYLISIHTKEGCKTFTRSDLINNAKEQEQSGIEPHYFFYDYKHRETITPAGWLVYSTYADGAGVVYKTESGSYGLVTGWQGDFIYN